MKRPPGNEAVLIHLRRSRVVAGFSVERAEQAVPIARALLAGGIEAVELTLRTPDGIRAIRSICQEVPEMLVGAGTILKPEQVDEAVEAGAHFGVSPGTNPRVIDRAKVLGLPFAPGICTPTDLEHAIERGCRLVKFFPAEACGGIPYLRSMAAPYRHLGIQYFPLGGINSKNLIQYLSEDNIPAVGGSWIVENARVQAGDWGGITARASSVGNILNQW